MRRQDLRTPNQMQGHCRKVLKVSERSTSVEKFVEALDNGAPPVFACPYSHVPSTASTQSPTNRDFSTPGVSPHDECEPSASGGDVLTAEKRGSTREKGIDGRYAEAAILRLGNQPGTTPLVNTNSHGTHVES